MGDFAEAIGSVERLLEWERLCTPMQHEEGIASVCQYNQRRFSDTHAAQIVSEHAGIAPATVLVPPVESSRHRRCRGDQVLTIELDLGDSTLASQRRVPRILGIVSPQTPGGTYEALHVAVPDADATWQRALDAGATSSSRCTTPSGGCGPASSSTPSVIAGPSTSTSGTYRLRKWPGLPRPPSGAVSD